MKKIKRIMAMLLAMVMVLGMTVSTMAADLPATASITIKNLTPNDNTTVKIYQVVSHDSTNSQWVAADWTENNVKFPADKKEAEIDWNALKTLVAKKSIPDTARKITQESTLTFEGLRAGAYLVIATGDTTQYSVMGVKTYKYDENNNLLAPLAAEVDAKGEGYTVTKTLNGEETLVNRGDELTFNIESVFPSFDKKTENRQVSITDIPTGQYVKEVAVYVGNMDTPLTVDQDYTLTYGDSSTNLPAKENETVTVNFTSGYIGTENAHAAQAIKVVVKTVVTDVTTIKNEAKGSHDNTPAEVVTKTGSITIKKVDESKQVLSGAKFSFKKQGENNKLLFVKVSDGVYKLAINGEENTVDVLEVAAEGENKGILKVQGLGQGTYEIVEEKAPDGYSVVNVEDVELTLNDKDKEKEVVNTTLSSLPETGGIGTTIFTIGGCVIMIAAAGLFFASRRKSAK